VRSRKRTALGRGFESLALLLGASTVVWLASAVLVQMAYALLPAQPSAAALRLEQEASQRPLVYENGFRSAGFAAPVGMDPVVLGACAAEGIEAKRAKTEDPVVLPTSPG